MKPYKKVDIVEMVAKEEQVEESVLKAVADCYWEEVRLAISEMRDMYIYIHELGNMNVKKSMLLGSIERNKRIMREFAPDHYKHVRAQKKLEKVIRLQEQVEEEYKQRDITRNRKNEYKKNLEKQMENPGGPVV